MALVLACVVLVAGQQASAQAQVVADPDFWKGTTERADTVYRFVYRQSPQATPSGYDPVLEAEEILRQRQAALPPTNPQAPSLWQRIRGVTGKVGLSTPLRRLATINLVAGSAYVGWQIGSGINAKFLKLGVPPATEAPDYYRWDRITWMPANSREYYGAFYPAQDGWVIGLKQTCCNYSEVDRWFEPPCLFSGFVPPEPFVTQGPRPSTGTCWTPQGSVSSGVLWGWAPENALGAPEPIQDYTNQPYSYWSPAPTPPPQTTVEDSIANELEQPENHLLRQWLNYMLYSPGEEDPLGIGPQNADIEFPKLDEKFEGHGHQFVIPYTDPREYWRDAADIVQRGRDNDPSIIKCQRSDGSVLYWDSERQAIVIEKEGKIETYFPPARGFDYFLEECSR